jgi:hypothetical protein
MPPPGAEGTTSLIGLAGYAPLFAHADASRKKTIPFVSNEKNSYDGLERPQTTPACVGPAFGPLNRGFAESGLVGGFMIAK